MYNARLLLMWAVSNLSGLGYQLERCKGHKVEPYNIIISEDQEIEEVNGMSLGVSEISEFDDGPNNSSYE